MKEVFPTFFNFGYTATVYNIATILRSAFATVQMNAKAERIENLIQIINRNLLLIYNGQIDGIIPLDNRPTARIDTTMFKGDKFGYEMVNFVRSYIKNQKLTIAAIWERNFVKGLESLITECAVVKDDIERECFVSRVYVWFVEKLVERRDLPDSNKIKSREISELKDNVKALGGNHTLKALDNYASTRQLEIEAEAEVSNIFSTCFSIYLGIIDSRESSTTYCRGQEC